MPGIPSRFLADIPQDLIVAPPRPAARAGASAGWTRDTGRGRRAEGQARAGNGTSPAPAPGIATGDKVRHAKFGDGIVMACAPSGGDFEVTVAFKEGQGVKRLLLGFANLEKV